MVQDEDTNQGGGMQGRGKAFGTISAVDKLSAERMALVQKSTTDIAARVQKEAEEWMKQNPYTPKPDAPPHDELRRALWAKCKMQNAGRDVWRGGGACNSMIDDSGTVSIGPAGYDEIAGVPVAIMNDQAHYALADGRVYHHNDRAMRNSVGTHNGDGSFRKKITKP